MRGWRRAAAYAAGTIAVIAVIYGAASLALQRDGLLAIGAASASRLTADYSTDGQRPLLPPLDAGIIEEIVADEEQLAAAEQPRATDGVPTPATNAIQDGAPQQTPPPDSLGEETSTPQATATPWPSETPRPEPTDTPVPEPSETPMTEPTETPEPKPSDTPTATRTPRPCPTHILELPPLLEDDDDCKNKPTPTPTPKKDPTRTPTRTAIIDDHLGDCLFQPSECD